MSTPTPPPPTNNTPNNTNANTKSDSDKSLQQAQTQRFIRSYLALRKEDYNLTTTERAHNATCSLTSFISATVTGGIYSYVLYTLLPDVLPNGSPNRIKRPLVVTTFTVTAVYNYLREKSLCDYSFILEPNLPLAVDTRRVLRTVYPNNSFTTEFDKKHKDYDLTAKGTGQNIFKVVPTILNAIQPNNKNQLGNKNINTGSTSNTNNNNIEFANESGFDFQGESESIANFTDSTQLQGYTDSNIPDDTKSSVNFPPVPTPTPSTRPSNYTPLQSIPRPSTIQNQSSTQPNQPYPVYQPPIQQIKTAINTDPNSMSGSRPPRVIGRNQFGDEIYE